MTQQQLDRVKLTAVSSVGPDHPFYAGVAGFCEMPNLGDSLVLYTGEADERRGVNYVRTTPVQAILEDVADSTVRTVTFKTKNTIYKMEIQQGT